MKFSNATGLKIRKCPNVSEAPLRDHETNAGAQIRTQAREGAWLQHLVGGSRLLVTLLIGLAFTGCSPKKETTKETSFQGIYIAVQGEETVVLDFRSQTNVIIKNLKTLGVDQVAYTRENQVLRLPACKLFDGKYKGLELSIDGETLVCADGTRFILDRSGRDYSPLEMARLKQKAEADAAKAQADAEAAKAHSKMMAAQAQLELRKAELAYQRQVQERNQRAQEQIKAEQKQLEDAKMVALASLPVFTNRIVTLKTINGETRTNIQLIRATPDGVVYMNANSAGGGLLSYTNMAVESLQELGLNPILVTIAQDRSVASAQERLAVAQKHQSQQLQQARGNQQTERDRAAAAAFRRRYGISN